MRALLLFLLAAIAAFAEDPQAVTTITQVPENLSIPARLEKTINTKKCKPGEVVELTTIEPVLLGNGLVMPEDAKLRAKIVGAASRQKEQPSWVLLVVEQATWKQHSVPLHAFVTSQITINHKSNGLSAGVNLGDFQHGRYAANTQGIALSNRSRSLGRTPRDASDGGDVAAEQSSQALTDLKLMQDKSGRVFLVSEKEHLKLPSGTMFMLRNQAAAVPTQAQTK